MDRLETPLGLTANNCLVVSKIDDIYDEGIRRCKYVVVLLGEALDG